MERSLPTFDGINEDRLSESHFDERNKNKLNESHLAGTNTDKLGEECGVVGIFNPTDSNSSSLLFYGLYALQHRGQESAGIASNDGERSYHLKNMGLVLDIFDDEILSQLVGHISIGHVRTGTTGGGGVEDAQPFVIQTGDTSIAMVHNGNIINAPKLRKGLEEEGIIFTGSTDSEVIVKLLAKYKNDNILESVKKTMDSIEGAYSLIIMTENELVGVRDPHALRPLCLGKLDDCYVLASESCAINAMGADLIRDLEPGEILIITKEGISSNYYNMDKKRASCIFEYVYFARPDSTIDGANVYEARKNAGIILAREHPIKADIVVAVPDSSIPVALGYSEELDIPYVEGLFKSKYVGRTFIEPDQPSRERTLKLKLTTLWRNVKGKKVVLVDDSIVRGNTSKRIVSALKRAGAKEVHVRISSPPIAHSCYYGIDTPDREQLVGATKSVEEIRELIGADSLAYLSLDGLIKSVGLKGEDFCTACFSGDYPHSPTRMTYKDSGVDVDEGRRAIKLMKEHVKSTYNANVLTDLGSFGGLFSLNVDDYKEPVLVAGTDGVGTKLKIAFMMDKHDTVGQDCVAMCVNDILCQGGKPLFFLDYIAIGKLVGEKVARIVGGIAEGCKLAGCALIGGETAEMPGLYDENEYDIAGFAVGIVDKPDIITGEDIEPGDVILGLPSSGIHSNGYSLVRKLFFDVLNMKTTDYVGELGKTLGEELLTPTKIYVKPILNLITEIDVKGICHITGGGFYENIPRILPENADAQIDMGSWEISPIFKLIRQKGNITDEEMFGTFNMGIGMAVIVQEKDAEQAVRILKEAEEDAKVIGKIIEGNRQVIL